MATDKITLATALRDLTSIMERVNAPGISKEIMETLRDPINSNTIDGLNKIIETVQAVSNTVYSTVAVAIVSMDGNDEERRLLEKKVGHKLPERKPEHGCLNAMLVVDLMFVLHVCSVITLEAVNTREMLRDFSMNT